MTPILELSDKNLMQLLYKCCNKQSHTHTHTLKQIEIQVQSLSKKREDIKKNFVEILELNSTRTEIKEFAGWAQQQFGGNRGKSQ